MLLVPLSFFGLLYHHISSISRFKDQVIKVPHDPHGSTPRNCKEKTHLWEVIAIRVASGLWSAPICLVFPGEIFCCLGPAKLDRLLVWVLLGETWGDEGNSFGSKMVQDGPRWSKTQGTTNRSIMCWLAQYFVKLSDLTGTYATCTYQIPNSCDVKVFNFGLRTFDFSLRKKTEACECRWCTRSSLILPPKALTSAGPVFAKEGTNQGIVREGLFSQSGYDKASQMPSKWAPKRSESLVTQIHSPSRPPELGDLSTRIVLGWSWGYNNACAVSTTQDTPWKFLRTCSRSNGQWCNCQHVY